VNRSTVSIDASLKHEQRSEIAGTLDCMAANLEKGDGEGDRARLLLWRGARDNQRQWRSKWVRSP
jgi:hypothetical protein